MRIRAGFLASTLLLAACSPAPSNSPSLSAAAQAQAKAEFTVIAESLRAPFPTWSAHDIDGYVWNTANLHDGITVVNFWASWCQPCVDEWADLQVAAESHPSVAFLGVDSMDATASARRFLNEHPTQYRHLVDDDASLLHELPGIPDTQIPTTVILDADHRIAAWKVGPTSRGQIRRALAQLL